MFEHTRKLTVHGRCPEGVDISDHALEHNTSLKKLDLSRNTQLVVVDGETVGCAIERMLNVNGTLERLNPSGCGITNCNEVATYLANGLQ